MANVALQGGKMKLRNKKTGEILRVEFLSNWQTDDGTEIGFRDCNSLDVYSYNSLSELNEDWQDYEEPKGSALDLMIPTLTNFIENEPDEDKVDLEDCKQMLEKLKAWKRLKDKGFKFKDFAHVNNYTSIIRATFDECWSNIYDDLELLFGGEE